MQNTNPKKLRAELKDYLDLAIHEPIKIQRRSGESYILINEEEYSKMQIEIMSLQRRLLAMANVIDGEVESFSSVEKRLKGLKHRVISVALHVRFLISQFGISKIDTHL